MTEEIIAEVVFNLPRDANDQPAGKELENAFGKSDFQQKQAIDQKLAARSWRLQGVCNLLPREPVRGDAVKKISGQPDHLREQHPNPVGQHDRDRPQNQGTPVFPEIWIQRLEVLMHEV